MRSAGVRKFLDKMRSDDIEQVLGKKRRNLMAAMDAKSARKKKLIMKAVEKFIELENKSAKIMVSNLISSSSTTNPAWAKHPPLSRSSLEELASCLIDPPSPPQSLESHNPATNSSNTKAALSAFLNISVLPTEKVELQVVATDTYRDRQLLLKEMLRLDLLAYSRQAIADFFGLKKSKVCSLLKKVREKGLEAAG